MSSTFARGLRRSAEGGGLLIEGDQRAQNDFPSGAPRVEVFVDESRSEKLRVPFETRKTSAKSSEIDR